MNVTHRDLVRGAGTETGQDEGEQLPAGGVIADHVLSNGGQAALVVVGNQFGGGLAVVAFSVPLVWALQFKLI